MVIGPYILDGQVINLKNPFLMVGSSDQESTSNSASLNMLGLVRKKIIFKTRPKPRSGQAKGKLF